MTVDNRQRIALIGGLVLGFLIGAFFPAVLWVPAIALWALFIVWISA